MPRYIQLRSLDPFPLMDRAGNALAGRAIYVYFHGTTNQVAVAPNSDGSGAPIAQPLFTDASGGPSGYVPAQTDLDVVDGVSGGTLEALALTARDQHLFYATDYNVKADGRTLSDVSIGAGSNQLSSAGTSFSAADVGKLCVVRAAGTPVSTTTTGALTSGVGFTALAVNALGSAIPPGGLQISSGANTQLVVTSGAKAGATSIPLIGAYASATSSALSTGAPITSIPCAPLYQAIPSGSVTLVYIDASNVLQAQTFSTTGAAVGATSVPVTSTTPNFAFPVSTTVLGGPTSVNANFSYPIGSTVRTMIPALSTTISGVSGGVATLAASAGTAVVSAGECFYATRDTAAWQSCINDAELVNGTVVVPEGHSGIDAPLAISAAMSFVGPGVKDFLGANGLFGAPPAFNDAAFPSVAPYLLGGVLVQCAPNADAIQCTVAGSAVHFERFGIRFAGAYQNTGHGINCAPSTGYGNVGGNFVDVHVFGVDGNHYGFLVTAPMNNRMTGLRSYGAGMKLYNGGAPSQPGNITAQDCLLNVYVAGTSHGLYIDGSGAGGNFSACLFANVNAQVNVPSPALPNTVTPTSAQQCQMTVDWTTMAQMSFDMASAQSQVTGSLATYPAGPWSYRTNDPSNAGVGNPTMAAPSGSGAAIPNQFGKTMLAYNQFLLQPRATASASTTLNGATSAGATSIVVASATGISVGSILQIDTGVNMEFTIVTSVSGTTIGVFSTAGWGLAVSHLTGVNVSVGAAFVVQQFNTSNSWPGRRFGMAGLAIGSNPLQVSLPALAIATSYWYRIDWGNATRTWTDYASSLA